MRTDSECYEAFLRGSEEGFRELVERYGDKLTLYLCGYTRDPLDAEDLMIEAFARVASKKPVIAPGAFKAYLFVTGRNLAVNHRLSLFRRGRVFSLEELDREPESGELVEKLVRDEERGRILRACMERIDPELREALYLVYVESMTFAQTAQVMGIKTRRVEYLLQKGKTLLRKELGKEGVTDAYDG